MSRSHAIRDLYRRKLLRPLLLQMRSGARPQRLAWSLALGLCVGVSPTLGVTTVLVILLSWIFRLNQIASQVGTHTASLLQLVFFVPFIELGVRLFGTRNLPLDREQLLHLSHHPLRMVQEIWMWEWHALVVWAIGAAVVMPLLAIAIRRGLVTLLRRHRALVRAVPVA